MFHDVMRLPSSAKSKGRWPAARGLALVALVAVGPGACTAKRPTGQVVALVNGQEVTTHDLDAEARALGVQDSGPAGPALLQRVVARVLLAQNAHTQGLDKDPSFPSDRLRMEQTMLAQRALQKTAKPNTNITQADIDQFVASHPLVFRDRQKMKLDQIRFQTTDPQSKLSAFQTLPALLQYLQTGGVQVQQGSQNVDTGALAPEVATKLLAAPTGKLLLDRRGDTVIGAVIAAREPVVLSAADQTALANQLLRQQRISQAVNDVVDRLRKSGKIVYQPGFAPKAGA